jgi:hypothetical protein
MLLMYFCDIFLLFCLHINSTCPLPASTSCLIDRGALLKRKVIFKQYTQNKHKRFGIRIYKLCNSKGYTYNDTAFKQRQAMCKPFHDSYSQNCNWTYYKALRIWDTIDIYAISFHLQCSLTIYILRRETAVGLLDKKEKGCQQNIKTLTNMHSPPPKGNFCDEHRKL